MSASASGSTTNANTNTNANEERFSIQDRLGSLFGSRSNSPRTSLDRSRPPTPRTANSVNNSSRVSLSADSTGRASPDVGEGSSMRASAALGRSRTTVSGAVKDKRGSWTPPIVNWLIGANSEDQPVHASRPSEDASTSRGGPENKNGSKADVSRSASTIKDIKTSPEALSTSPTEQRSDGEQPPVVTDDATRATALKQAISEEAFKIQRPPEARMLPLQQGQGHSHRASTDGKFRPPVLLDNLARASLPISSLTRTLQFQQPSIIGNYHQPSKPTLPTQPNLVSSPTGAILSRPGFLGTSEMPMRKDPRMSIDSLRSLTARDRGIQTSASSGMFPTSAGKWWFQDGNKELVDEMLKEDDRAPTVEQEAESIRKKYLTPKLPIVFCHGLLGFDSVSLGASFASLQITHWRGIKEVLEENGIEILITKVPATSGVEERAKVLEEAITATFAGREIHLIGHSMGGLDCRYLASRIRPTKFKIRSVTTIATPHRGSYFADWFLDAIGKTNIPSIVAFLDYLPNGGGDGKAFEGLTREAMKKFNEEVPDVEDVLYFSWGAACQPSLVDPFKQVTGARVWPHGVILEKEGPNDGLVSVASAQWGKYLGTLEEVNHLDLVGWVNAARYKWAELFGKAINFKPASFYLEIASRLAEEVEGLKRDDEDDREHQVLFGGSSSDEEEDEGKGQKSSATTAKSGIERPSASHIGTGDKSPTPPSGTLGGGVD
ncbi:hypothetical protein FRC17_001814 [Serendipita sp. 399]|nr:hypothetical protein FRC17_001814 [Serendipita sp. 399]